MICDMHPGAEQDLADAVDFYAARAGLGVAQRFLIEFERIVSLLLEHPELGTPSANCRRMFPMRIFPYSVVYQYRSDVIRILVIRHQRRKPGYGGKRH